MSIARVVSAVRALAGEARWRGLWGTVVALKLNKFGSMKNFVHEDEFGNRYFENRHTTYGRDRWIEYSERKNPDSSRVPPEWHAWLHHIVDERPSEKPLLKKSWEKEVTGNLTGTQNAYAPVHNPLSRNFVGLAKEKTMAWDPKSDTGVVKGKPGLAEMDIYDLK